MPALIPTPPVCFVSAHLDDVALSCSNYLADHKGVTVITVMAGAPNAHYYDDWNARTTGRSYAPDAIQTRQREDADVMEALGAHPIWLDLWDRSYMNKRSCDENIIVDVLRRSLKTCGAESIVGPLGIRHSDHVAVSNACYSIAREISAELYYYEDVPYASEYPRELEERLVYLHNNCIALRALEPVHASSEVKKRIFKMYRSQYKTIRRNYATFKSCMSAPEYYWKVEVR